MKNQDEVLTRCHEMDGGNDAIPEQEANYQTVSRRLQNGSLASWLRICGHCRVSVTAPLTHSTQAHFSDISHALSIYHVSFTSSSDGPSIGLLPFLTWLSCPCPKRKCLHYKLPTTRHYSLPAIHFGCIPFFIYRIHPGPCHSSPINVHSTFFVLTSFLADSLAHDSDLLD